MNEQKSFSATDITKFVQYGLRIKKEKRGGWLLKGIEYPESVSEHCQNTGMIALLLAKAEGLDPDKVAVTAFMHDIGEALIGDVIWEQGVISNTRKQANKHLSEKEAVNTIFATANQEEVKQRILEFLDQTTPEARLVKDCDKLEMVFQALDYEQYVSDPNTLLEFWENAAKYLKTNSAWAVFEELKKHSKITHPLPSRLIQKCV